MVEIMKATELFDYLAKHTDGILNDAYIDLDNNTSISVEDCQRILDDYSKMYDDIEMYISNNDLDDVIDCDTIKQHFKDYEDYMHRGQACLIDEYEYALKVYESYTVKESITVYRIINKQDRDATSELKYYTFEQLKAYFEPDKNEQPKEWQDWERITDVYDLEQFLEAQAAGMEQPYEFEKDEVESIKAMDRANKFYNSAY